jgi:Bacterial type II/III secretion system short domain
MRTIAFLCLFSVCAVCQAQENQSAAPTAEGSTNSSNTRGTEKAASINIFYLKYAKASLVRQTLSQLGLDAKITEDDRLNALIVQAESEVQKTIAEILETVDAVEQPSETTKIIQASGLGTKGGGELVQQFAKISGVDVAFDENLGIFMIKGPKTEVDRVRDIIAQIGEVKAKMTSKAGIVENRALRVLWLSNEPTEDSRNKVEPDVALTKSIEKLAELGFTNMQVKMQLLGRCDIIEDQATCKVEGALLSGNIRRTMKVEANLSYQEGISAINGKFHIMGGTTTHPNLDAEPEQASVEVTIKLEPKKYYILSAAPVGGYQTAFVVQLIDGL